MVYLVRTAQMLKGSEELRDKMKEYNDHIRANYPAVKDSFILWNITGLFNEFHWVMEFESLADEEKWATAMMQDEKYMGLLEATDGVLTDFVDKLYRRTTPS